MKVLQINVAIKTGSTGRIVEQLGERIVAAGEQSVIAFSRKIDNTSASKMIKIGSKIDFYKHVLSTRIFDNHGFASKKSTEIFLNQIEEIKPDVIHLHNIHGYYIHVGRLFDFLAKKNIPIVWTLHDCWPFTGHCAYFDSVNCDKWKTACLKCPLKRSYPASWYIDNSRDNFIRKKSHFQKIRNMTIVTPSGWLKDLVLESFLQNNSVKVIHNGVDLSIFKPKSKVSLSQYKLENKTVLLGVASIWESRKGLDDFVALSKLLSSQYQIVLVGLTAKQKAALPDAIIGIERTESLDQLVALYNAAAIYINPTYSDNFPTTNIEALACGTPVITYRTGGSPEAIDSNTGLVVEKGAIEQLVMAVEEIGDHTDRFTTVQCRSRAEALFNKDERFDDYVALYNKVVSQNEN